MKEAPSIVGNSIGKPGLEYVQLPMTTVEPALKAMGLPEMTTKLILEMWDAANGGMMVPQETRSESNTTPTTLASFVAAKFASAFLHTD
jgi:hypothetical protein